MMIPQFSVGCANPEIMIPVKPEMIIPVSAEAESDVASTHGSGFTKPDMIIPSPANAEPDPNAITAVRVAAAKYFFKLFIFSSPVFRP